MSTDGQTFHIKYLIIANICQDSKLSSMLCCTQSSSWLRSWRWRCFVSWSLPCLLYKFTWDSWETNVSWKFLLRPIGAVGWPIPHTGFTLMENQSYVAMPVEQGIYYMNIDDWCIWELFASLYFRKSKILNPENQQTLFRNILFQPRNRY